MPTPPLRRTAPPWRWPRRDAPGASGRPLRHRARVPSRHRWFDPAGRARVPRPDDRRGSWDRCPGVRSRDDRRQSPRTRTRL